MVSAKIRAVPAKLTNCKVEEEVKNVFCAGFGLTLDASSRIDLYTPHVLFEFKFNRNLSTLANRAKVIAQTLYYFRRLKLGTDTRRIPEWICGVDKDEGFLAQAAGYRKLYTDDTYDWDRAPSTPDPRLVESVAKLPATRGLHVHHFGSPDDYLGFVDRLLPLLNAQGQFDFDLSDKKVIDEYTFLEAFHVWDSLFGDYVKNHRKPSEFFVADIQEGGSFVLPNTTDIAFEIAGRGGLERKPMPMVEYDAFWQTYEKCRDHRTVVAIRQRFDRMTVEDLRRFTGEFYTPVQFAAKAIEYLTRVIGDEWWTKGYRLWDMAAGSGNLEYELPEAALPYCYVSTLLEDDAAYCRQLYPTATVFRYDYLDDDVDLLFDNRLDIAGVPVQRRMPQRLVDDLADPDVKWIVFINPPFATANVGARNTAVSKDDVSMTRVRSLMTTQGLGETSRELFSQFLWRISREFAGRKAYLGLFSKIKYVNANNDQRMRDEFFRYRFRGGFCFPSTAFDGNRGNFPVGFLVWRLDDQVALEQQAIEVDVFNREVEKIGRKQIPSANRTDFLSKWVPRPRTSDPLPPLSSAITVAPANVDVRNRVAPGFLASMMAKGNEMANQNYTALLSSPYVSAGAFSVVQGNFERAMVTHAVRRLPKATWLNDRDQFMQPTRDDLDPRFVGDCVVWSFFSDSNGTASMRDIEYDGLTYQIQNHLYPFPLAEVKEWDCSLSTLATSLAAAKQDRFGATWLTSRDLSQEAQAVLAAGKAVYRTFYRLAGSLHHARFRIAAWDVGWYQVRTALTDRAYAQDKLATLKTAHTALGAQILPRIRSYGFLPTTEHLFADTE